MFGSVIADYVYSLEQDTAGAGIAWFRERFPKNYYPYNAGQLISVKTSKHVTTGKNLATKENCNTTYFSMDNDGVFTQNNQSSASFSWVYSNSIIKMLLPMGTYTLTTFAKSISTNQSSNVQVIDDSEQTLANNSTMKSKTKSSVSFTISKSTNIGIVAKIYDGAFYFQLEKGSTPTDYTPYVGYEYPLDPNLELRGIPKLDGNKTYYDGDTYESSGSVTRKYGIIDLGTITWTATPITNAGNRFYSSTFYSAKKPSVTSIIPNIICSKYEAKLVSAYSQAVNGITISTNGSLQVYDVNMSSLTAAQFKTAMSGVYLVYELDTPTTESAASFENPQRVDPNGVEMYEDTRDIPLAVGHETKYLLNPETPTILTALVGTNNVYSDAGDVDVEYYTTLDDGGDGE